MGLKNKIDATASKISSSHALKSVRRGLINIIPLILLGSFSVLLLNLPIPAYQEFIHSHIHVESVLLRLNKGTFAVLAVLANLSISYSYLSESKVIRENNINPLIPTIVVLGCFFAFIPDEEHLLIQEASMTSIGLFEAIVVAIVSSWFFCWFYKFKKLRVQTVNYGSSMVLNQVTSVLFPSIITIITMVTIKVIIVSISIDSVVANVYSQTLDNVLTNEGGLFATAILFELTSHILWYFGMHGANMLDGFAQDVFVSGSQVNEALFAAGLPPTEMFTKQFFDTFVHIGGSGATISLLLILLIKGRKSNSDKIAKISFVTGVFNINEMVVYGLPIVLNPFFLIPFIITPVVFVATTALAMFIGLVPLTVQQTSWTTPPIIGGYIATGGHISGSIMQIVNIIIGMAIYLPFVNMYENHVADINLKTYNSLIDAITYIKQAVSTNALERADDVGFLARSIAGDLRHAIAADNGDLHLEYQPQVNYEGKVVGCEALLRWDHKRYGKIPPFITVTIADDSGQAEDLGEWVLRTAYAQKAKWDAMGLGEFILSANLSAVQLKTDKLPKLMEEIIMTTGVSPREIELELTENIAIDPSAHTNGVLNQLKKLGILVAIDDFGMGHSSLLYIRDYSVDVVKIDGSLVHNIADDTRCQEIIASITNLCGMLGIKTIAEFVEKEDQKEMLHKLKCDTYQGYLYARSLSPEVFTKYLEDQRGKNNEEVDN